MDPMQRSLFKLPCNLTTVDRISLLEFIFLTCRDVGCIYDNIPDPKRIKFTMNPISAESSLIGPVIGTTREPPLQIIIKRFGIGRLCKGPMFNSVNNDGYTPALLMNIKSNKKRLACKINFFSNLCLHSLCVFNYFTYSNLM